MSQIPSHFIPTSDGGFSHPGLVKPNQATQSAEVYRVLSKVADAPKPPKRIRQSSKPLLNKLEQEWGEVIKHRFHIVVPQSLRFMLGNGIWYKPDFIAWPTVCGSGDTRMRAFEVKGPHAFRGGFENLKVAASKYPQIKWTLVWKQDGQWQEQTVLP